MMTKVKRNKHQMSTKMQKFDVASPADKHKERGIFIPETSVLQITQPTIREGEQHP